jgi:hypothetical protein
LRGPPAAAAGILAGCPHASPLFPSAASTSARTGRLQPQTARPPPPQASRRCHAPLRPPNRRRQPAVQSPAVIPPLPCCAAVESHSRLAPSNYSNWVPMSLTCSIRRFPHQRRRRLAWCSRPPPPREAMAPPLFWLLGHQPTAASQWLGLGWNPAHLNSILCLFPRIYLNQFI